MRIELPSGTPAEIVGDSGARGLVLVPDIMGLRPLFDDLAARLATEWDCRVCAIELYPGNEHLDLQGRFDHAPAMTDDDVLGDMVAAADLTGAATVGAIGFCMGGMYINKAVATARFHRLVSFYGMINVPGGWKSDGQGEPLEMIAGGDSSTLMAVIGERDPYTPAGEVAALVDAGVATASYADAEHGFVHDPDRPGHRVDDAADAWRRTDEWLWS